MSALLADRVALVTGASRGIGRCIALALAGEQCNLVLVARGGRDLAEVAQRCRELNVEAAAVIGSITERDVRTKAVDECIDRWGRIDVLVNNAASAPENAPIEDYPPEDFDSQVEGNLLAHMALTRLVVAQMVKEARGVIVNISSFAGVVPIPQRAGYCAAKAGLIGFSRGLFEEVRKDGIKVSVICPGTVNTGMAQARSDAKKAKLIQPEDVAAAAVFVATMSDTCCPTEILLEAPGR